MDTETERIQAQREAWKETLREAAGRYAGSHVELARLCHLEYPSLRQFLSVGTMGQEKLARLERGLAKLGLLNLSR